MFIYAGNPTHKVMDLLALEYEHCFAVFRGVNFQLSSFDFRLDYDTLVALSELADLTRFAELDPSHIMEMSLALTALNFLISLVKPLLCALSTAFGAFGMTASQAANIPLAVLTACEIDETTRLIDLAHIRTFVRHVGEDFGRQGNLRVRVASAATGGASARAAPAGPFPDEGIVGEVTQCVRDPTRICIPVLTRQFDFDDKSVLMKKIAQARTSRCVDVNSSSMARTPTSQRSFLRIGSGHCRHASGSARERPAQKYVLLMRYPLRQTVKSRMGMPSKTTSCFANEAVRPLWRRSSEPLKRAQLGSSLSTPRTIV